MRMLLMILALSCGIESFAKSQPSRKIFTPPEDIDLRDMSRLPDILPTMYYTPSEADVSCKGRYGRVTYKGHERATIRTPEGSVIATVCKRFERTLLMEGSAILKDRGEGKLAVNYGGKVRGEHRYYYLDRCKFGEGVRRDLCLLPYHTLAADNKIHKVDEIVYVPEAKGILLPDGTRHEGFFIVRDTGGAFTGIGSERVDMFTGTDPDFDNAFKKAGFHHKRPMDAFKIKGESAELVRQKLRERFQEIY